MLEKTIYELRRWMQMNQLPLEGLEVSIKFKNAAAAIRVGCQIRHEWNDLLHGAGASGPQQLQDFGRFRVMGVDVVLPQVADIKVEPMIWEFPLKGLK